MADLSALVRWEDITSYIKSLRNNQAKLDENIKGVEAKFMVIHGLERRTFKDQEDLDRTDKNLSSSSRNNL